MYRALSLAKTIIGLLAIELFVPGGTLVVLAMVLSGRRYAPLSGLLSRRFPALTRLLPR